jgi:tRNA threonylcarbamoyladenosine biosynthesis protein TsaB
VNLLGFDTSTAATAACVLGADGRAFEVAPPVDALRGPPGHARELMPAVAQVMSEAGLGYSELDAIAVGVGPGTFTGLRIGAATARALAAAHGLELRPVSSLAALAAGIEAPLRLALIDARRGELFAALYENGRRRLEPIVATPSLLLERVPAGAESTVAAGDGSLRFRQELETGGITVAPEGSEQHVVRGVNLCRLAAGVPARRPEAVVPDYIRRPDVRPAT